jgi:hypothetical protein
MLRQFTRGPLSLALLVGFVAGCDGILEVDLPGQIVEGALFEPAQAAILVNSAIGDIECAYSEFIATDASGFEDVFARVTGWWGGSFEYRTSPNTVACNTAENSYGWWTPLQAGRFLAEESYRRISGWSAAEVGPNRERLLAQSAIYAGVAYNLLGDYMCEIAIDGGPLMTPDQTLAKAEEYLTTAIGHINTAGDFAMPATISPSARQMAHLLRARVRFSRGDMQGAAADAALINQGFVANISREAGGERRRWNRVFNSNNGSGWGTVIGAVDWWRGPGNWPAVIPFTGYRNLGVLPDGRAVSETGHAITTVGTPGAVADTRVPVRNTGRVFNGFPSWVQEKYTGLQSPIPLANWREAWLMLAEIEGGQAAIDRVNAIRAAHNLPLVTYLSPNDQAGITRMIIEERRRSLFLEARYWTTKLRHDLWFPRGVGQTPYPYPYQLGVRMAMPDNVYELNTNFTQADRGSKCGNQRPAI